MGFTSTITITWDANTEPDLSGYKIYAGRVSTVYTATGSPKDVGNVTSGTFTIDAPGLWFFAVQAYDTSGNHSEFSVEVSRSYVILGNFPQT